MSTELKPSPDLPTQEAGCSPKLKSRRVGWFLFCFLWFMFASVHQKHFDSATPVSRLDLLLALFNDGSFNIDRYHQNTGDKALFKGHYYSDKAPGTVAVVAPVFLMTALILKGCHIVPDSNQGLMILSWACCALVIAPLSAAGGVALFKWLCRFVTPKPALLTIMGIYLGAAPWPYSTMLFSHSLVVGLISIALWAMWIGFESPTPKWFILSGFCCGLGMASEYTAGIVILGIACLAWWKRPRWIVHFAFGALFPLLLIPVYSWICFETPFTIGYSHQATIPEMRSGFWGLSLPNLHVALELLFLPRRGLFFWTPFLFLFPLGFFYARRLRELRVVALIALLHIVVMCGTTRDWPGGYVLGPRFLAPCLPLLAVFCAIASQRIFRLSVILVALSILLTGLGTMINATPPADFSNPFLQIHLIGFISGDVNYNFGQLFGLRGSYGLVAIIWFFNIGLYFIWRDLEHTKNEP